MLNFIQLIPTMGFYNLNKINRYFHVCDSVDRTISLIASSLWSSLTVYLQNPYHYLLE